MIVIKLILFTLLISGSHCRLPEKVYCANEGCDKPISKATTLLNYNSPESNYISFRGKSEATVYMKSADPLSDVWYVNIEGKSGFVPKRFLREKKVIEKNPQFILPYVPKTNEIVQPDKVRQAHEVFEGTTIYTTEASVDTVPQDSTTPPPISSANEELTTPLVATSIENTDDNNETDNQFDSHEGNEINDSKQESSQNSENLSEEIIDAAIVNASELPNSLDETNNEEIKIETPTENSLENLRQDLMNDTEINDPVSNEQIEKELSNELPTDTSIQKVLSTTSSANESEPLLEKTEDQGLNTINETVETDSNHENVLLPNINNEEEQHNSQQLNTVSTNDENIPKENISQDTQDIPPILEDGNNSIPNNVQTNDDSSSIQDESSTETVDTSSTVEPPTLIETLSSPETPKLLEGMGPSIPPESETVTADPSPFVTTETIPALFPQDFQTIPAPEIVKPVNNEESIPEDQYNQPQGLPFNTESTFSTPNNPQSEPESIQVQERSHIEENIVSNEEPIDEISSTETPIIEENTEGIFSNIYSTVADIWPPTTEVPPPIYNTEDYPTYESEKSEETQGFSFTKYFFNFYYSVMGTSEETKALFASVGETCYTDEYCDGTSNDGSNRLLTFLLTTASSVLLFTLGYYYIDNRRQDGRLIGQINSLQRDLLFTTKECEILKEQLSSTKSKLAGIEDSSFGMDDMVQSLKEEIDELKAINDRLRNSLDDNEKLLRVSENTAGELQNTLSEVENTLSELLAERANSEEQIIELNSKIQAFEEELISVSRDRDNFQLKYVSAESALEELKKHRKQLDDVTQQLSESRNVIELQKHEINALRDAIKELKSGAPSNVDVTSLLDHTEIKAKLAKALEEKKSFESKYEIEYKERTRLAEELQNTQDTLHTTSQNANEALTRLDVLGKYFQERESELMKELNAKESLWLSKQGESTSTVEKIELLQQEVQRYKEKCDALTLELAEQESSRRAALSAVESRAHSAWLEARGARRDADAARDEAAALRRKLASLSNVAPADGAISPHHKVSSPLENIDNPVIPPPLPPMFLPPPLLPPLPRPPPLGRLPSPHPPRYGDRRYSPESRYSPGSRYSPDSRYSPETVRYSPDSRYSPRSRRSAYSPRSRRRSRSRERYEEGRPSRSRNGPADTETEYNSDSPSRQPRRRRYSRHSGPSSGSGCSSESDK